MREMYRYQCELCGYEVEGWVEINNHMLEVHYEGSWEAMAADLRRAEEEEAANRKALTQETAEQLAEEMREALRDGLGVRDWEQDDPYVRAFEDEFSGNWGVEALIPQVGEKVTFFTRHEWRQYIS